MRLLLTCLLLLASASVHADQVRAVVTGPRVVVAGDVADFDSGDSVGGKLVAWRVRPDSGKHRVSTDGRRLRLSTEPGVYRVQLIVAGESTIADATVSVLVLGEGEPLPQPRPGPTPGPQPVPPDPPAPADWEGIAADVAKWASVVKSPTRRAEAEAVAAGCDRVADRAAAGEWKSKTGFFLAQAIAGAASAESRKALGKSIDVWERDCFGDYNARVTALYQSGKLAGENDWVQMLRATARGLRSVR